MSLITMRSVSPDDGFTDYFTINDFVRSPEPEPDPDPDPDPEDALLLELMIDSPIIEPQIESPIIEPQIIEPQIESPIIEYPISSYILTEITNSITRITTWVVPAE